MILVCYVTLQDHVIKEQNYCLVRRFSKYATILSPLVAISTLVVEIMNFVCHVARPRDYDGYVIMAGMALWLVALQNKSPS